MSNRTDLENWFGQDKDWIKKLYATLNSSKNVNSYRKKVTRIVAVSKACAILLVATLLAVFFGEWDTPVSSPLVGEFATTLLLVLIWILIGFLLYDISSTNPQSKLVTYLLKKRRINWEYEFNKRDALIEVQFPDGLERNQGKLWKKDWKNSEPYALREYSELATRQVQSYLRVYMQFRGHEILLFGLKNRTKTEFELEWFSGRVLGISSSTCLAGTFTQRVEICVLHKGKKERVYLYMSGETFAKEITEVLNSMS